MEDGATGQRVLQALRDAQPPGTVRLAGLIQRYGKAIEYDLARMGIDLAQQWRSRRWRKLLNLIDRLPRNSAYVEALAEDDELAQQLSSQPRPNVRSVRRMTEWSVEVELLSVVADRLAELAQVVATSRGAKRTRVAPMPRPLTAGQRLEVRQRHSKHLSLVSRVLPPAGEPAGGGDETTT
jgi:hypothetical protein